MCEAFAFPTLHRAGHVLFGLQVFHVNMANHHPVSQKTTAQNSSVPKPSTS
jgi:hypothetical protein